MLRLLHKVRQDVLAKKELNKYLWYAVGEIFLLVAGILIALQINNWNEERIEQKQIGEYAVSLAGDVKRDIEMLAPIDEQISHRIAQSQELARYMQGKSLSEISNIDLYAFTRSLSYRPFGWNRTALEQLKSAGALRQIKNQELVRKISEYDALTRHLDQDYTNDENHIRETTGVMMGVVDVNYPQAEKIAEFHLDSIDGLGPAFFQSDLYRALKSDDLPLLTDDINAVRRAANNFIEIGTFMAPRVESEFPRLREIGLSIIELIESEYEQ
jgi:hypothetical protein